MKPAEHSSWFYASVLAWQDSNLTAAFSGLCRSLELLMRSGTVAQLLVVKDELVETLLNAMQKDVSKSATNVFSHLLSMLAKDLGEEMFHQFVPIWKALCQTLIGCEDAEVSEAVLNCQMFFLRRFSGLLVMDVPKYGQVFVEGLLETPNPALRRTAANTLAYYFCQCMLEDVTKYLGGLEWSKKKVHAIGEALVLGATKRVELVKAAFADADLSLYVCIKTFMGAGDWEEVWKNMLECTPSINLLTQCVALRKSTKVKMHKDILKRVDDASVEQALLLAFLLKSCNLPTLLSLRKEVGEKLGVVNRNALVLFLNELGFDMWQAFSGMKITVESWVAVEADCIIKCSDFVVEGSSLERRLLMALLENESHICKELIAAKNPAALLHFKTDLPRMYLLSALSSHVPLVVERALESLESPICKKLLAVTQIPTNLERYREKINLITALERDLEGLKDSEYEELFWYLLGACHIKMSLLMPAVSKLLNQAASRKPKIWAAVFTSYLGYISEKQRDVEVYNVVRAPQVVKEKAIVEDDNLCKLKSLHERVQALVQYEEVQFGEQFCKHIPELQYSMSSSALFGSVLKVIANAPAASNPLDLNSLLTIDDTLECGKQFKKAVQSHFVELLTAYSKSFAVKSEHLMNLLAMGDEQIQSKALDCLSSNPEHAPIIEQLLRPLLMDKTWREHLAMLTLQRRELLFSHYLWTGSLSEFLVRVLYGRLIARKQAKNKGALQVRRKAILGFVATWPEADLDYFVAFTRSGVQQENPQVSVVLGYLSLLEFVFKYVTLTERCVNESFDAVLGLMNSIGDKRVRSLGMKRLVQLLQKQETSLDITRLEMLLEYLRPMIERLSSEYMQNESNLLELLELVTKDERYSHVFKKSLLADSVVRCLAVNPRNKVFLKVLLVLENVLGQVNEGKRALIEGLLKKLQTFAGLLGRATQAIFSQLVRLIMLVAQEQKGVIEDVDMMKRALLPLLKLKKLPVGIKIDVCRAASGVFGDSPALADEYFKVICGLTISNTDAALRCALLELIGAMSILNGEFTKCYLLLQELFAMMPGMLEEADYDRRFRCFSDIRTDVFSLDQHSKLLLAHVCLYYVLNEPNELSMRNQSMLYLTENIASVVDLYLEYLPVAFKSEHEVVRLDYCSLMGKAVPVCDKLSDLTPLLHGGDEEAEVFGNLAHLQQHRKIRAIRRLCNGMPAGHFLTQHFITLMLAWAVPIPGTPSAPALQQEAAKAVGELCGKCTLKQAHNRLNSLLGMVEKDKQREKAILKTVPFVLEHMPLGEGVEGLLPRLMELMRPKGNSTEVVRIPIAIALAQLFERLGKSLEYMPAVLSALIVSLKSKLEDTRREARDALQSIFKILAQNTELSSLVEKFIREMRAVMEPGYQRHVMIFTLNHILTPLVHQLSISDGLFDLIVQCMEEDLFGQLSRERGAKEWTGKVLEAKSCRSFDLLGSLGKVLSVERLQVIHMRFRSLGFRNVKNLEKLLNVWLNSLDRIELLPFLVALANPKYINTEERYNEDAKWQLLGVKASFLLVKKISTDLTMPEAEGEQVYVLKSVCFAHLFGTHSSLMIASLRFICYSLKWACWGDEEKRQILLKCFELIVKSAGNVDLVSECFKYVSLIVRDHSTVHVSDQQLKALLTHTRAHVEDLERQQLTFSLLKSFLTRAVATEHYPLELYELMSDVSRSMVTSHHAVTRQHCRYLMAQFLAECPLSEQKFVEHVEKVLTDSANYVHLTGRNSARELVMVLLKRRLIKEDALRKRVFLVFTGSYAQETETEGLDMIDKVIAELAEVMKKDLAQVNEMLRKWLESGQSGIVQAALRALGVIHSVTGGKGLSKDVLKHLKQ